MKKQNIIISIFVMMLLLAGLPLNSSADILVSLNDFAGPKFPGELVDGAPAYQHGVLVEKEVFHPKVEVTFLDDLVIDIIQDIDETLYLSYLEDLVAFGPRRTGTSACWAAGNWIYDQFVDMGLETRYHNWSSSGESGSNIEATLLGINESSDEIYIICAHYDSVTGSPGADDNGAGTAAVLVAAYLLSQYASDHTIRFVAFSGEEQGLLGSYAYAQQASQNGDNIVGVLNGDMIGYAISTYDGDNIKIYENSASHWLLLYSQDISNEYDDYIDLNIINSGSSGGSDHYPFWQYGYDAVFYHEYHFNDYYHSPQDIIANMNISYAVKCSRLMIATLAELGEAVIPSEPPSQPLITGPSSGFIGHDMEFSISSVDPEGEEVFYFIEWDDGMTTGWIGPYNSGEVVLVTHQWDEVGEYDIIVQAEDIHGVKSKWSNPYTFTGLHGPILDVKVLQGGLFKVKTIVANKGDYPATDVPWTIMFDGGAFIGAQTTGIIPSIPIGEQVEIASDMVLGFGPTVITVSADVDQGTSDSRVQNGFVFLFIVTIKQGGGL